MCQNCFESEYYKFDEEKVNSEIEQKITKLLSKNILFLLSEIRSNKFIYQNYIEYKCYFCEQVWCYSIADLYWRGFLIKKENAAEYILKLKKNDTTKKRNGYIILLVLLVFISLFFILNSCSTLTTNKNITGIYTTKNCVNENDKDGEINYIKFFNGNLISAGTDCSEEIINFENWFNSLDKTYLQTGIYSVKGNKIMFETKSKIGIVKYKGIIIDSTTIKLNFKSKINGYKGTEIYKLLKE